MKKCLVLFIVLVVGCMMFSVNSIHADSIEKPHTFSAGTPAISADVNDNFDVVYDQVNKIGAVIHIDETNSRVGVGTPNPDEKLTVDGTIESTSGGVKFPDGSIQTTAAAGDGHSLDAADGVPADAIVVDDDGNVGIGTSNPGAALHVEGTIEVDQKIQANDSGGLELATDEGETRLIIHDNGNVGVGVANPGDKLSVQGIIESTTGGFRFPDGTLLGTAPCVGESCGVRKLIKNFVVAAGESVTAGDVVSYIDGYIQKGFGPGNNVAYGSETEFNTGHPTGVLAIALSTTKFVVVYNVHENSETYSKAVVGNVSGNTITFGNERVFNTGSFNTSVTALSSSKFVVAYQDVYNYYRGMAIIGDVSGNKISFGSEKEFNRSVIKETSIAALTSTRFVITYRDFENNSNGRGLAIIGDVSNNNITFKPEYVLFPDSNVLYISITALSSSKFVATYLSGRYKALICDVSGDAITQGPEYDLAGNKSFISVAALSPSKFVLTYQDRDDLNLDYGAAVIGDVSANMISFGPEYEFNSGGVAPVSATALSETRFVVAYSDSGIGTTVIGDVSGDAIVYGLDNVSKLSNASQISAIALSSGQFVVVYNNINGMVIVGNTPPDNKMVGIADEDGGSGETTPVVIGGVSDVHSGLTPGEVYYADASGDLTTERDYYTIGLAVSPTEIILASDKDNRDQFFGDMVFANEFRITEADQYEGLILKNHFDREIFTLSEEGALNIHGAAMKPGGGSWGEVSDERLIKNVAYINGRDALDKLCSLQGVAHEWINAEEHGEARGGERAGILAQELETVFPGWVSELEPAGGDKELLGEGEKAKAVSFPNDFYAYLIEAIKELKAENEVMRKEFHAENEALKREIEQLKAAVGM